MGRGGRIVQRVQRQLPRLVAVAGTCAVEYFASTFFNAVSTADFTRCRVAQTGRLAQVLRPSVALMTYSA
jgi:hypothetical protein